MVKKRQTASKQKILEAYIKLIKDKVTDEITVTDICKKAEVNRGTFYLHYIDKYDLDDEVTDYYYRFFSNIMQGDLRDHPENITKALQFIYEERDFYRQIIAIHNLYFEEKISKFLKRLLTTNDTLSDSIRENFMPFLNLPAPYSFDLLTTCIARMITIWIQEDFQESPEELTQMILSLAKT